MYSFVHRQFDSFSTLFSSTDIDTFLSSLLCFFPLLSSDELNNVRLFCDSSCSGCVYVFPSSDFFVSVN
jgi:hypothetical protein